MNKRRAPQSYKELLQVLSDLFDEIEPSTAEEVASYLDEQGYDRKALVITLRTNIDKAISSSPLNWRNKVDESSSHKSDLLQAQKKQPLTRHEIVAAIRRIYTKRNVPFIAHYRNLEEATDEDLLSLLEDLQELDDEQAE